MEESERRRATFPCASHTIHFTALLGPGQGVGQGSLSRSENQMLHLLPSSRIVVFFPLPAIRLPIFAPGALFWPLFALLTYFFLSFLFIAVSFIFSLFSDPFFPYIPLSQLTSADVPYFLLDAAGKGQGHLVFPRQLGRVPNRFIKRGFRIDSCHNNTGTVIEFAHRANTDKYL